MLTPRKNADAYYRRRQEVARILRRFVDWRDWYVPEDELELLATQLYAAAYGRETEVTPWEKPSSD